MDKKLLELKKRIKEDELLRSVNLFFSLTNTTVYLVGGYIRDLLLGKESSDIDIIVDAPTSTVKALAHFLNATVFYLRKREIYARVMIMREGRRIDVSFINEENFKEELERRDFTINSMAINITKLFKDEDDFFIDYFNGLKDIDDKVIRQTNPNVFEEDPIRVLRAFRFKNLLGFEIEKETMKNLKTHKSELDKVSPERMRDEFFRITLMDNKILYDLYENEILTEIFPHLDFEFLEMALTNLDEAISKPEKYFKQEEVREVFVNFWNEPVGKEVFHIQTFKLALLSFGEETPALFIRKKFNASLRTCTKVQNVIFAFKYLKNSFEEGQDILSIDFIGTFFRTYKKETIEAYLLLTFYYKNSKKFPKKEVLDFISLFVKNRFKSLVISGNEIVKDYGLTPSPFVGDLLMYLKAHQILEKIKTKEDAKALIDKYLKKEE
jgi:tRNA nucleotidyltransferase/poly(A) polymerase